MGGVSVATSKHMDYPYSHIKRNSVLKACWAVGIYVHMLGRTLLNTKLYTQESSSRIFRWGGGGFQSIETGEILGYMDLYTHVQTRILYLNASGE